MPYQDLNPAARGWQRESTSADAAPTQYRAETVRALVLEALDGALLGLTSYEIADQIGIPYHTVQPRTSELRNAGKIRPSREIRRNPQTGKGSRVWEVVR